MQTNKQEGAQEAEKLIHLLDQQNYPKVEAC
jgi:hypothetical protein